MAENKTAPTAQPQFDYKNTALLLEYLTPHARIASRRRTGLSARRQRQLAQCVKRARFMALLPYVAE